jgi:methyl acetate hydrolase
MTLILNRRRLLKTATALAAATSLAGLGGAHAAEEEAKSADDGAFGPVDQMFRQAIDDRTLVGIVALGATDKGIVYEGAFGKRDIDKGPAMSPDTVFWIASMTKAVTATACMQLVEQGKLQLDQPMGKLLPELASPRVLEGFDATGAPKLRPARRPITLRHLLTHTSGYTYSIWSEPLTRYEKVTGMPDIGECKNSAFAAPLEFDPGDRWQYGISMDWVGKAVEAVTDQSLEVYFRENIFAPLGITDTGFLIGSAQKRRVATMYSRQADGSLTPVPFEMPQRPEFFMGGGGLFSTPRDYMTFLQMLLREGTFQGVKVLKPETVASMRRNHIGDLNVGLLRTAQPAYSDDFDEFPGMAHKWGLSFDINPQPVPGGRSAGSISWGGLFNTYFWIDHTTRVTGAVFTQVLPFFDAGVVKLYGGFEKGLYEGLSKRA